MATTLHTQVVLDALSMALWQRARERRDPPLRPGLAIYVHRVSASAAVRRACAPRWESVRRCLRQCEAESFFATLRMRVAGPTTVPGRRPRRAWQSSSSLRASRIRAAGTPRSATCRPSRFERQQANGALDPGAHHPAAVLGPSRVRPGDVAIGGKIGANGRP